MWRQRETRIGKGGHTLDIGDSESSSEPQSRGGAEAGAEGAEGAAAAAMVAEAAAAVAAAASSHLFASRAASKAAFACASGKAMNQNMIISGIRN